LNPYQQISILAELKGVARHEIEEVLKRNGEALPKYSRRSTQYGDRQKIVYDDPEKQRNHEKEKLRKRLYYKEHREEILQRNKEYKMRKKGYGKKQKATSC
jgi:hypothetical protein